MKPNARYRRIALIGPPGAGKSHLVRRLAEVTGLPPVHLDQVFWQAGWVQTPREDWLQRHAALIAEPAWIIDGNYAGTLPERVARADMVILLDYPLWRSLHGVLRRWWRYRRKVRPDAAPGCPERFSLGFLLYVCRFRREEHPRTLEALQGAREAIVLHSPADIPALLLKLA